MYFCKFHYINNPNIDFDNPNDYYEVPNKDNIDVNKNISIVSYTKNDILELFVDKLINIFKYDTEIASSVIKIIANSNNITSNNYNQHCLDEVYRKKKFFKKPNQIKFNPPTSISI